MPVLLTDTTGRLCARLIERKADLLLAACGRTGAELSVLITDDPGIAELNSAWRGRQGPTNVLAFAMQEGEPLGQETILGDVVISLDTAAREAAAQGISLHQRVAELLVHGLVHLLGLDHERSPEEARRMAAMERDLLERLNILQRRETMVKLAINVDHVATLRQARGIDEPDPVTAAAICELAGAAGIVVHLREDRRHIQDRDVRLLRQTVKTKLNLEMGADEEIIAIALEVRPDMVTLVPEKRQELTTEGGLDVLGQERHLAEVIARFREADIPVSLFIDPDLDQVRASRDVGATFVEIHTGRYCDATSESDRDKEFELVARAAEEAYEKGLRVNAGHGLNYQTTARIAALPFIEELSIGHAVMARAILVGLDQAVREMLAICQNARR